MTRFLKAKVPGGELLLEISDGEHKIRFRPDHWSSWDPAVPLLPLAVTELRELGALS